VLLGDDLRVSGIVRLRRHDPRAAGLRPRRLRRGRAARPRRRDRRGRGDDRRLRVGDTAGGRGGRAARGPGRGQARHRGHGHRLAGGLYPDNAAYSASGEPGPGAFLDAHRGGRGRTPWRAGFREACRGLPYRRSRPAAC
jgi:hypothetical protein